MLTEIRIKNFRSLLDVRIPLSPLTVFIGPNGSGKTNVIRALSRIGAQLRSGDWSESHRFPRPKSSVEIGLTLKAGNTTFQVSLAEPSVVHAQGSASFDVSGGSQWHTEFPAKSLESIHGDTLDSSSPPRFLRSVFQASRNPESFVDAWQFLTGMRVASLAVPMLRDGSPIVPEVELGERGENFAAVLDAIAGSRPDVQRAIAARLREVAPEVSGFTTVTSARNTKVAAVVEGDQVYRASDISDGLLLYLGLTTAAQLSDGKSLLVVEEPENGIHPRRLRSMLDQIRSTVEAGTQVILTTHSPLVLDVFRDEPESVIVFDRDVSRGTVVRRLSERDDALKDLGEMSLGDLWYSGAIGGVPAK